jgi:DNA mismatch endonuclease, patch repair protein
MGLRFRLHARDLPGRPDIVLPRWRVAIFVHGCFWHRHARCRKATTPNSNRPFWEQKFAENTKRDKRCIKNMREAGWTVFVVWECETSDERALSLRLKRVFGG